MSLRRLLALIHERRCATCVFYVRGRCALDGHRADDRATNRDWRPRVTVPIALAAAAIALVRVASVATIAVGLMLVAAGVR